MCNIIYEPLRIRHTNSTPLVAINLLIIVIESLFRDRHQQNQQKVTGYGGGGGCDGVIAAAALAPNDGGRMVTEILVVKQDTLSSV